jgi:MFS family permease
MIGMLLGGILWGVLGDKRGRLSVLFGSILLYSLANIANGMVTDVTWYAVLRFVAGVGLAGELGAGITLVSESMSKKTRGYGTTFIAGVGILGAVVAVIVGKKFDDWRVAYYVGGGLGLLLLGLRVGVVESLLFKGMAKHSKVSRGNFFALFSKPKRALRFICLVFSGIPIWYAVGVLYFFAPEIGEAMGLNPRPNAGDAVLYGYIGLAIGDIMIGVVSQVLQSRKRALLIFVALAAVCVATYFVFGSRSVATFYWMCLVVGVGGGYWAIFVTVASEQFGTNLRATATTTAPNFVRGATVPLVFAFNALRKGSSAKEAAMIVGAVTLGLAFVSLFALEETFGRDLDFVEE